MRLSLDLTSHMTRLGIGWDRIGIGLASCKLTYLHKKHNLYIIHLLNSQRQATYLSLDCNLRYVDAGIVVTAVEKCTKSIRLIEMFTS